MIVAVQPKKGSKSGQRHWKLVDEAADDTEDKKQRKQRFHREDMVQFRLRKKLKETELRTQHGQLEQELQHSLVQYKLHAMEGPHSHEGEVPKVQVELRELIVQTEALRVENSTLRDAVASHNKLQQLIHSEANWLTKDEDGVLEDRGWRVNFAEGQPSFHSRKTTIVQRYDEAMTMTDANGFVTVGTLLGWKVERVPLVRHNNGKWMVTRVRFSKLI
ncbi:hypothetical protein PI124_g21171 [Phytophthora idaei]|nr:hypothetical protein PI125_g22668 [Phytophthora idaei]KAG3129738.1 hypothetical protein PI126_g20827 [Phytophthora idaei]KAG3233764.1 hypothetical protein PI124_g21171 [Phytophthora idaei]